MKELYSLSASAIIYALLNVGRNEICGIRSDMKFLKPEEVPDFVNSAEQEFSAVGCGQRISETEFQIEEKFRKMLTACADCSTMINMVKNLRGRKSNLLIYLTEESGIISLENKGKVYSFYQETDLKSALERFLEFHDTRGLEGAVIDTDLLENVDKRKLVESGCAEETAALVAGAFDGSRQLAVIQLYRWEGLLRNWTIFSGREGILTGELEYDLENKREFMCFMPYEKEKLLGEIMAEVSVFGIEEETGNDFLVGKEEDFEDLAVE